MCLFADTSLEDFKENPQTNRKRNSNDKSKNVILKKKFKKLGTLLKN